MYPYSWPPQTLLKRQASSMRKHIKQHQASNASSFAVLSPGWSIVSFVMQQSFLFCVVNFSMSNMTRCSRVNVWGFFFYQSWECATAKTWQCTHTHPNPCVSSGASMKRHFDVNVLEIRVIRALIHVLWHAVWQCDYTNTAKCQVMLRWTSPNSPFWT